MNQTANQPAAAETGMWAAYEAPTIGESLDVLEQLDAFVLLSVKVREAVPTQHGPRDAVDLVVQTTTPAATREFSGFAAGIVGQAKRVHASDLPAVCRVVKTEVGRGKTRALVLIQRVAPGGDLAAIARSVGVPLAPINGQSDDIPY